MADIRWSLAAVGAGAAVILWAVVAGLALLLPDDGTVWTVVAATEMLAGLGVSILLFGGCGYLFGRIIR